MCSPRFQICVPSPGTEALASIEKHGRMRLSREDRTRRIACTDLMEPAREGLLVPVLHLHMGGFSRITTTLQPSWPRKPFWEVEVLVWRN